MEKISKKRSMLDRTIDFVKIQKDVVFAIFNCFIDPKSTILDMEWKTLEEIRKELKVQYDKVESYKEYETDKDNLYVI